MEVVSMKYLIKAPLSNIGELYTLMGFYSSPKKGLSLQYSNNYLFFNEILLTNTQNTDANEAVSIKDIDSETFITREGNFSRAGLEYADEAEIFLGAENKLTLFQTYNKRFQCTYLLHDFPFDVQVK